MVTIVDLPTGNCDSLYYIYMDRTKERRYPPINEFSRCFGSLMIIIAIIMLEADEDVCMRTVTLLV